MKDKLNVSPLQAVLYVSIASLLFAAGVASHDTIKHSFEFYKDLAGFNKSQVSYQAPLSEYEKRTQALLADASFQATCTASARAIVALEIANDKKNEALHFLDESDKEFARSQYTRPMSEALANASTSQAQARKNFVAK